MLLTLVPLLLAGVVTLEICVLIGLPLNFANIIALPLLLGVGVAFKIYYIMAWREGQTNLLQSVLTRAVTFSRLHHGDGLRQPVVFQPSRNVEHGQIAGDLAVDHDGGGGGVPAGADGQAARAAARSLQRKLNAPWRLAAAPSAASDAPAGVAAPPDWD